VLSERFEGETRAEISHTEIYAGGNHGRVCVCLNPQSNEISNNPCLFVELHSRDIETPEKQNKTEAKDLADLSKRRLL
jgi:hypothetical protein